MPVRPRTKPLNNNLRQMILQDAYKFQRILKEAVDMLHALFRELSMMDERGRHTHPFGMYKIAGKVFHHKRLPGPDAQRRKRLFKAFSSCCL